MLKYYYGLKAGELDEAQSYLALNVGLSSDNHNSVGSRQSTVGSRQSN
jgi:hypothetical protein